MVTKTSSSTSNMVGPSTRRRVCVLAAAVAIGLLSVGVEGTPHLPRFSWDTVPAFYHSCNYTGAFTADAIQTIAKFPLVVIEKGMEVDLPGYAEDKIGATIQAVKAVNPNISGIFYYNSGLDWPFYRMHEEFLAHPDWWLRRWPSGEVIRSSGDSSFPNHTNMLSFDFAQPAVRDFYASECLNMSANFGVDGCFIDQAAGCRNGNTSCINGHVTMFQQLQSAIGSGLIISNNDIVPGVKGTMMEGFQPSSGSITQLQHAAANGVLVQAHVYGGACTGQSFINGLAAFLIGAGRLSYFGCSSHWSVQSDPVVSAWHPEFELPLGEPHGLGTLGADGVWARTFSGGSNGLTVVRFDSKSNIGSIAWNGQTAPPTPPPPPPPPTPSVPAQCGAVMANVGQANAEISVKNTTTAAECCALCQATASCVIWAWHTEAAGQPCHLHTAAATRNPNVKGCYSAHLNTTAH